MTATRINPQFPQNILSENSVTDLNNVSSYITWPAIGVANNPFPNSNRCLVITANTNTASAYNAQIAFTFSDDRIAIRRRYGGGWTSWKYVTLS